MKSRCSDHVLAFKQCGSSSAQKNRKSSNNYFRYNRMQTVTTVHDVYIYYLSMVLITSTLLVVVKTHGQLVKDYIHRIATLLYHLDGQPMVCQHKTAILTAYM